jgi:dolichol-phosphate mannosyltransferase
MEPQISLKQLIPKYNKRLFLEQRPEKLGLGTAYIMGFKWAINKKYDYFLKWMLTSLIILKI